MSDRENRARRLEQRLREAFNPTLLEIVDDSARHAGHAGARAEGETHFSVLLVAPTFSGLSRVARARAVHERLAAEFGSGMHALSLTLRSPEEHSDKA